MLRNMAMRRRQPPPLLLLLLPSSSSHFISCLSRRIHFHRFLSTSTSSSKPPPHRHNKLPPIPVAGFGAPGDLPLDVAALEKLNEEAAKRREERKRLAAMKDEEQEQQKRADKERKYTSTNIALTAGLGTLMIGWAMWEVFDDFYAPNERTPLDAPLLDAHNRARVQDTYRLAFDLLGAIHIGNLMMVHATRVRVPVPVRIMMSVASLTLAYKLYQPRITAAATTTTTTSGHTPWVDRHGQLMIAHMAFGLGVSMGSQFVALALIPFLSPMLVSAFMLSSGSTTSVFGHNSTNANPGGSGTLNWLLGNTGGFMVGESVALLAARAAALRPCVFGLWGVPFGVLLCLKYPHMVRKIVDDSDKLTNEDEFFALVHAQLNPIPHLIEQYHTHWTPNPPQQQNSNQDDKQQP